MCYIYAIKTITLSWIFVSNEYKSSSTFKCTKSLSFQNLCTVLFLLNLFLSSLFDFCEAFLIQRSLFLKSAFQFSGVEVIVVVLHDSLISIVFSRSLDSSFSRKDLTKEKQSYNVLILLAH